MATSRPIPVVAVGRGSCRLSGEVGPGDQGSYLMVAFDVAPGVDRLDLDYDWEPLDLEFRERPTYATVIDLGLWDHHGYRDAAGFRGWSGCRHRHVWIAPDSAQRGYRPGPVGAGRWYVELGFGSVGPVGARWTVRLRGSGPLGDSGQLRGGPGPAVAAWAAAPEPDPVDAGHVARAEAGWYHGDFHMHSWHSHPEAPDPERFVAYARAAGLEFLPVTEYVVAHHWETAGALQRAHPDLVVWPGREIVTYRGHVQCVGETPGFVEYRHGFEDVTIGDIQARVRASGALFGVNHPTAFAGPVLAALCRGCAFELGEEIDWDAVDMLEVLTGPMVVDPAEYGIGLPGTTMPNPFFASAVALWERLLEEGHRICAVSGSDDKLGPGLGTCATVVGARQLSRSALVEGVRDCRAYIKTMGASRSPSLAVSVTGPDGQQGTLGSVIRVAEKASGVVTAVVEVTGGAGEWLRLCGRSGVVEEHGVDSDRFSREFRLHRLADEGPLGTWWRFETVRRGYVTSVTNPIFLTAPAS